METWKQAAEAFTKEWEKAASTWWDGTLRQESTLEGMRQALLGVCAAKERSDQALEQLWASYRLPSATDLERVHERVGEVEERVDEVFAQVAGLGARLGKIEELLQQLVARKGGASA
jgi:hypothetical protein